MKAKHMVQSFILTILLVIGLLPIETINVYASGRYDAAIRSAVEWLEANQKTTGAYGDSLQIMETSEVLTAVTASVFSSQNVVVRASSWLGVQTARNNDDLFRMLGVPAIQNGRGLGEILAIQHEDGGWGMTGSYRSDVLDTLLALDALMSVSLTEISAASNGVSYLLSMQNPDGGWSYAKDAKSSKYLTAHTLLTLQNYRNARRQPLDILEMTLLNGRQFLLSSIDADGTWGTTEDAMRATLFACAALRYTDSDLVDAALDKVIEAQRTDGSLYASPSLTARLIWLLGLPEGYNKIIADLKISAKDGSDINAYTEIVLEPEYEDFDEDSMDLVLYIEHSKTLLIPVIYDNGYYWNTEDTAAGEYNVYSLVFDKETGRYIEISKWSFEILPSVGIGIASVFTNPVYTRVSSDTEVKASISVENLSNTSGNIITKTQVFLDGEIVAVSDRRYALNAYLRTQVFEAITFMPDVSFEKEYLIRTEIYANNTLMAVAEGEFWVVPLAAGETTFDIIMDTENTHTQDVTLAIPTFPPIVDIVFSFDLTGSMGGIINTAKSRAVAMMTELNALGMDINYGVVSHRDYSDNYPYRMNLSLTDDIQAVSQVINTFSASGGGDSPESYTRVLYESYSDETIGWRDGSRRILVMFGDDVPHDNDINEGVPGTSGVRSTGVDPGRDGINNTDDDLDLQTVLAEVAENHITILPCWTGGAYANYWNYWAGITGGKAYNTNSINLIEDVINAVTENLSTALVENLRLVPSPGFDKWIVEIKPASYSGSTGVVVPFTVILKAPEGTLDGLYTFKLDAIDEADIHYGAFIFNITIGSNAYNIQGEISLNKPAYDAREDVQVSVAAQSFIEPPITLTGTVEIVDAAGFRMALLDGGLSFDDELACSYVWNTGDNISGTYMARLRLYDGEALVCETTKGFQIKPEGGFKNGIYSEKRVYPPETVAVLHDTVENTFRNYYPGRVTDTITVRDKAGNIQFTQTFDLGNMFAAQRDVTARWGIGRVTPGEYTAEAVVREDGVEAARSECVIEVRANGRYAFAGELEIPQKTIQIGEGAPVSYDIENVGDAEADAAYAIITVLDPETLAAVYQRRTLYNLPIGTKHVGAFSVPPDALSAGEYLVIYNVEADGVLYPMRSGGFSVISAGGSGAYELTGSLEIPRTTVRIGEDVAINYMIENTGDAGADNAYADITVRESATSAEAYRHREAYSLPAGAKEAGTFTVPADALSAGSYDVIYEIEADGARHPVQNGAFTVASGEGGGSDKDKEEEKEEDEDRRQRPTVNLQANQTPLGGAYVIEGIDIDTGKVIYTATDVWGSAEAYHVFAPRIPGWLLADGEADFQVFYPGSLPDTVRFRYREDTSGTHEGYLFGYPDLTVRADSPVTRAEAAAMMYRLIRDPGKEGFEVGQHKFTDTSGHWAEREIEYLGYVGLVTGYPDGGYRPNADISREELIAILVRYANTQPDIVVETGSGGWSGDYVDIAVSNGYIKGFPDGTLRLQEMITRAQTVAILNRIWDRAFDARYINEQELKYTDIQKTHWSYADIVEASLTHMYRREGSAEILIR